MGPGPSDVNPRILEAMSRPTIGHMDPAFIGLMDELKKLLQFAFKTENALTLPISAPGSAGMEACFVNLVSPGDKVIIAQNGVFGGRMKENVERCGASAVMVNDNWGRPVDPQKVEDALKDNPDAVVFAFVHAETSTGARSDADTLCRLARSYDCLSIVDAVTSLGGIDVDVDRWGADAVYSGLAVTVVGGPHSGHALGDSTPREGGKISLRGGHQSYSSQITGAEVQTT